MSRVVCFLVLACACACVDGAQPGEGGGEGEGDGEGEGVVPRCAPTAGGPFVVEEGALVTVTLACATDRALTGANVHVSGVPDGAQWDEAALTLTWQTDLDDAQVATVTFTVVDTAEIVSAKIAIADALFDEANVPIVDPIAYGEELGLPVIFVTPKPQTEEYVPADIVIAGRHVSGEIKLRGAFSLSYPKNSYTVKLDEAVELPWLGGGADGARDKLVLTSTFDDNAYVRQRMLFTLWNALSATSDAQHVEVGTANAIVYVDLAYEGLYVVTDHIDRDLFGASLDNDEDGNLYKAINHDANFKLTRADGSAKGADLGAGYVMRDEVVPPAFAPWDDLFTLVVFATGSTDAAFDAELDTRIAAADLIDWWVLASFTDAADSAGKNSYLYWAPDEERFRAVPWDFNHSLGQAWESSRTDPLGDTGWYDGGANGLFQRMLASPTWGPLMRARADAALAGALSRDDVLAQLDADWAEVSRAAERDWAVWGDTYREFYAGFAGRTDDFTTPAEEVAYTRAWIEARWTFLETRE